MYITREEARAWIPLFQAFIDKKPLQVRVGVSPEGQDVYADIDTTQWLPLSRGNRSSYEPSDFRVKGWGNNLEGESCGK